MDEEVTHYLTARTELGGLEIVRCTCGWTDYTNDFNEARRAAKSHLDALRTSHQGRELCL